MRTLPATLLAFLLLSAAASAAPIQITGKILHPPKDVQVELRPWGAEHAEALRQLKGETIPPIASARPRLDGSFAIKIPDTGFYTVVVRAGGHLAMQGPARFVVEDLELPAVELPPASPLEVQAVGADSQPLAGVTIQALPLEAESGDWRTARRSAVTDAEGKAVFPRAQGEALTLVVTTPGRYSTASTNPTGASQTMRFPAQRTRMVEFRGADGKPAAGALVRFARRGWPYGLTGEDGRIPLPVPSKDEIGLFAEDSRGLRIEVVMTAAAGEGTDVPVVSLRTPTAAAGRVLDASSREPIPGALVWNGGTAWTRTGAGGTFELRAPSGDQGYLEASAAGRMVHFQHWTRDRNDSVTFLLEAAASISGRVVDEEGKPVEGALIRTILNSGENNFPMGERSSTSGPDGGFLLGKIPARRLHAVEAELEGFAPARQLADSTAPVRLVLRRGALAIGRVVDEEGLPVAGAQVSLAADGEGGAPFTDKPLEATTDAEGRFRFPKVSAGRFSLRAESPGFAAVSNDVFIPELEPEADLGEIRLPPGGAIEGILTDARGKPVEKAWVSLHPSNFEDFAALADHFVRSPSTGPDGRFRIENLPRGLRVDVEVQHSELLPAEVSGVEVPTAQPLRIRLESARSLAGRVVGERGEPVVGASVRCSETTVLPDGSQQTRSREEVRTDAEGRFVLSRVSPGKADLQASAPGYRSREVSQVQVPEDRETEPVEIVLEAGTSLEGRVLDSEGRPVRHARVQASVPGGKRFGFGEMADVEGRYEIVDLEPGPCEIEILLFERGGTTRIPVEILPGRNRLDLRLPAGVEVSGRAVDSQGEPVPGVNVSLEPLLQEGTTLGQQGMSSADGSFVLADVTDGKYRLIAARSGFGPVAHPGEIRVDGAPVAGIELRLSPGAVIRGRILGLPPEEVRSVEVHAVSEELGLPLMATVSPGPAYRIADVSPGEWHVVAQIAQGFTAEGKVEVAAGVEEVVFDLELPAGFTVTGRVLLDREPLSGATVAANSQDGLARRVGTTGQDGAFRLEHVPGGSHALVVALPQDSFHYQTVEIGADLDVAVEISTGAVTGRALLPEGLPASGAIVTLVRDIPEFQATVPGPSTRSDEQGAFEILRLPAGTYKMTVQTEGYAPAESRVVVAPGGTVHLEIALGVFR
jgi:protocatechuate 3,4-dioxygenase beta subunit